MWGASDTNRVLIAIAMSYKVPSLRRVLIRSAERLKAKRCWLCTLPSNAIASCLNPCF